MNEDKIVDIYKSVKKFVVEHPVWTIIIIIISIITILPIVVMGILVTGWTIFMIIVIISKGKKDSEPKKPAKVQIQVKKETIPGMKPNQDI